jgi:hypothetical protein
MIPLVPGTYLEPAPGAEHRESRQFWAITDQQTIQLVSGYQCPQKGLWWVPELNYSMWEGKTLFVQETDALQQLMDLLKHQKAVIKRRMSETEYRLRELGR